VAASWFDYDNDGPLDLIVSDYTVWNPKLDVHCTMDSRITTAIRGATQRSAALYHNLGMGNSRRDGEVGPRGGASQGNGHRPIADFNDDGWPGCCSSPTTPNPTRCFMNRGNGDVRKRRAWNWASPTTTTAHVGSSMGCDAKDFDNDGKVDIFYNNRRGRCGSYCGIGATCLCLRRLRRKSAG